MKHFQFNINFPDNEIRQSHFGEKIKLQTNIFHENRKIFSTKYQLIKFSNTCQIDIMTKRIIIPGMLSCFNILKIQWRTRTHSSLTTSNFHFMGYPWEKMVSLTRGCTCTRPGIQKSWRRRSSEKWRSYRPHCLPHTHKVN